MIYYLNHQILFFFYSYLSKFINSSLLFTVTWVKLCWSNATLTWVQFSGYYTHLWIRPHSSIKLCACDFREEHNHFRASLVCGRSVLQFDAPPEEVKASCCRPDLDGKCAVCCGGLTHCDHPAHPARPAPSHRPGSGGGIRRSCSTAASTAGSRAAWGRRQKLALRPRTRLHPPSSSRDSGAQQVGHR